MDKSCTLACTHTTHRHTGSRAHSDDAYDAVAEEKEEKSVCACASVERLPEILLDIFMFLMRRYFFSWIRCGCQQLQYIIIVVIVIVVVVVIIIIIITIIIIIIIIVIVILIIC